MITLEKINNSYNNIMNDYNRFKYNETTSELKHNINSRIMCLILNIEYKKDCKNISQSTFLELIRKKRNLEEIKEYMNYIKLTS